NESPRTERRVSGPQPCEPYHALKQGVNTELRTVVGQFGPGTGSSCEPDEGRGSQLCPAYSLYVERRWRPSNVAVRAAAEGEASGEMARKIWRSKLAQYPQDEGRATPSIVSRHARAAVSRSCSEWASETKAASNCEGARKTPRSSMPWKNRA